MALGLFALLLAQVAGGPAPSASILVEGVRDRDRQIRTFVKDLTPADIDNELSRFEEPVCPAVYGLASKQGEYVADRIRTVARAAGAAVAKPRCDANLIVFVTPDKAALLKMLASQRDDYAPQQFSSELIRKMERDPSPVAAWQLKTIKWVDGYTPAKTTAASNEKPEQMVQESHPLIAPLSRIRPEARREFRASVLVIQADALAGLTTTQLADYVAMRSLTEVDPAALHPPTPDTILKVIDAPIGAPTPLTLTAWDMSFLKAFYASANDVYAGHQRADVAWRMKRELDKAATAQR